MLKTFIEVFDLPKDIGFKMIELENAIMKKFGSIQYFYHKKWTEVTDYQEIIEYPEYYTCGTKFEWECNKICSKYENAKNYKTREEALMGLLIENERKFQTLVQNIYKGEK